MSENWAVCRDYGAAGNREVIFGYASKAEAEEAARRITAAGGIVYGLWRTD